MDLINNSNNVNIFRVVPTCEASKGSSGYSPVLLLHRTKANDVVSILKSGIKPSQEGPRGPGVYLTDSINYAHLFGRCFARDDDVLKCFRYYFVCETKQSHVRVPSQACKKTISYQEYLTSEPSLRVFEEFASEPVEFESSPTDKFDSKNNRILQGTFQKDPLRWKKALAHHDLVLPVYLVEVEESTSVREVVNHVLYDKLEFKQYSCDNQTGQKSTEVNNSDKVAECTVELILKEMKVALAEYQQTKLKSLKLVLDKKVKSVMQQLTFKMSSIFEDNSNAKYKAELLQKENDDYKFILSTIANKTLRTKYCKYLK